MRIPQTAVHAVVAATVVSLVAMQYNGTLFSWHPVLMSVGFLGLMSEGVLTALKFRRLEGQQRVAAIQTHLFIQAAATLAVTLGFVAIARNKILNGKAHFKTIHGKAGLATLLLAAMAPLGGLVSFRRLGLIDRFPDSWHGAIKWAHRKAGTATWLISLLTVQLALTHPAARKPYWTPFWQLAVGALGLAMFAVAYTEPSSSSGSSSRAAADVFQPAQRSAQAAQRDEAHLSKTL